MLFREKILKKFYKSAKRKGKNLFHDSNEMDLHQLWRMQQISLEKINIKISAKSFQDFDIHSQKAFIGTMLGKMMLLLSLPFLFYTIIQFIKSPKQEDKGNNDQKHNGVQKNQKVQKDFINIEQYNIQQQTPKQNQEKGVQKTYFKDVLGINEYKEEIEDILDFLKNPVNYYRMGCNMTKGILLTGPPGVGKTLLAKALANEAQCHFIRVSGSDFDQIFVGTGQRKVQSIFKEARLKQPCIIFIDEFDSVGGKRVMDHEFYRGTLNQLLAEMDGFEKTDKIVVIAATNLPDSLDPAIRRSGRFDRLISIPYPSYKSRIQIFKYYLNKVKLEDKGLDIETIANLTTGFTGADIKNLINQSAFETIRQGRQKIIQKDIETAFDRVIMGLSKQSMLITEEQKLKTAYHEAGHALMSLYKKGNAKIHKVTILPRGQALGFTGFVPEKDNQNYNKQQLLGSLMSALGGRAAEEIIYGNNNITTGCGSDLQKATQIAYQMIAIYGMNQMDYLLNKNLQELSDQTREEIDIQVQKLVQQKYKETIDTLNENKQQLEKLAKELVKKETLSRDQILKLIDKQIYIIKNYKKNKYIITLFILQLLFINSFQFFPILLLIADNLCTSKLVYGQYSSNV